MSNVATRFAPSPTGALHIGGVRTALFCWLYSKNKKGTFHLRIEDTDKERSKDEHKIQIIKSLKWIGIEHDGELYIQSTKINDHIDIANELLKNGHAYKCYCSTEEIEDQKKRAKQKKLPYTYNRKCRELSESDAPKDIKPVVRFKSKIEGSSILKDLVQGDVEIDNITIEDFIILRNDGTVWTVGENNNGQLGQGNLTNSMNAIQVPGLTNIISVGAGEYQSFAIDNNGNLYVWGNNGSGQLGLDDLTNRLDPTLSPLENVINAQGGAAHSAFLTSDEKVFTAGDNSFGQLGTGNFTNSTVVIQVGVSGADMISTGQYTTLVKRADMSVFGFGNNTEDQLSLTGLSVNTPEHIIDLDGVSFIEASKSSSHVIYSTTKLCSSQDVLVNMLTTPLITITAVNDLLSAISGTSYQWYFNGNPIPGETNQTMIASQTGDYSVEVTFANGCTGISDVYFFSMVSIENLTFENVNVFPNPTNDLINIQLTQELNELTYIEIRDQAGRLVKEVEFNNGNLLTINVSELENGIYHVLIQNASVSGNIRFVKSTK